MARKYIANKLKKFLGNSGNRRHVNISNLEISDDDDKPFEDQKNDLACYSKDNKICCKKEPKKKKQDGWERD